MAAPAPALASVPPAADTGAFPSLENDRQDAHGGRTRDDIARRVYEAHRKGLAARRERDLTAEKYLLHIDGEGDNQWADILYGSRVEIPRALSEYRQQENLLRPLVDNMVAYHCAMLFHFAVDSRPDRESRERARIDAALVNHICRSQRWNDLTAQALYLAAATGFCPLHAYWRDDLQSDPYEPLYLKPDDLTQLGIGYLPRRGIIDCWVGNPFGHVFNPGARRGSVQWQSYERVLPADLVRRTFDHVPAARTLQGSTRIPSASVFQRIARAWYFRSLAAHGTAALLGADTEEELIAVICREWAPGVLPDWPNGRLVVIAVNGAATANPADIAGSTGASPVLLADMELPGRRFSSVTVYSHHRVDDVHGKPYVGDLDDLQVQLNVALSQRHEWIQRALRAPTFAPAGIVDDTAEYNGYEIIELEPQATASFQPRVLELPSSPVALLNEHIEQIRSAMFRVGGWQAASRGESRAGDPAAKVVALQRADDSVHGPTNASLRHTLAEYAQLAHALFRQYADVGWVLDMAGGDVAHLADAYVDRTRVSEKPPVFRLVSLAGATPEAKAQQLLTMVQMRGADGQPVLRTDEFRRLWPEQDIYDDDADPLAMQKRRAQTINRRIRELAERYRAETGFDQQGIANPWVREAAFQLFHVAEQEYPRLPSDHIESHIAALAELEQDETEDALVRVVAMYRGEHYRFALQQQQFAAMQAQMGARQPPAVQGPGGGGGGGRATPLPPPAASRFGGTPQSEALSPERLQGTVRQLTELAGAS